MMTKRITTVLGALALAGLLTACGTSGASDDDVASVSGGGSSTSANSDNDGEEALFDWAECMRDEGVDIPDPTRDENGNLVISGGGINIGGGRATARVDSDDGASDEPPIDAEDMEAAFEACGEPPALGPSDISDEDRQARQEAALKFARCMRDEGIEDFPDPDFSDEGPGGRVRVDERDGRSGDGRGRRLVVGPFGEIDLDDPEVAAAFEACQDVLGRPGATPGPGGVGSDEASPT